MSTLKTQANTLSVTDFLNKVEDEQKKQDSFELLKMMEKITGEKAVMWGTAIVGFGKYHYKSERSRQEGDWMRIGFSPRKQNLTLYVLNSFRDQEKLLSKVGKHTSSVGCLYIKKLADVDKDILTEIIDQSYRHSKTLNQDA